MAQYLTEEEDMEGIAQSRMQPAEDQQLAPMTTPVAQSMEQLHDDENYQIYGYMLYNEATKGAERAGSTHGRLPAHARQHASIKNDKPMTGKDYAEWLSNRYGWFNNNTASMVVNWFRFKNMPAETAKAFIYGMQMYDATPLTENFGTTAVATATDPLNFIGFGVMKAVGAAPKWVVKKQMSDIAFRLAKSANYKAYRRAMGEAAAENALMEGTNSMATREAFNAAGWEDHYGMGDVAKAALVGGGIGAGFGGALGAAAHLASGGRQATRRVAAAGAGTAVTPVLNPGEMTPVDTSKEVGE